MDPELQRAYAKYRSIFENAVHGLFQTTVSGEIIVANPALAHILDYDSPAELMAAVAEVEQLYAEPSRRNVLRRMLDEQGVVRGFEVEARRKGGGTIWVSVSARAVRDSSGKVLYYEGTVEDASERKRAEALRNGQNRLLEMIAKGEELEEVLTTLARLIESESHEMRCSILLLDEDGIHLRHGAAPSLPESYTKSIDGAVIGPCAGSCGTAAYRAEPVIVTDILTDPLWADWRDLASAYGLRACWSTPVMSSQGKVLGTFAMYYGEVRSPGAEENQLIAVATHIAGMAMERKRAEQALHESEELYRLITDSSNDLICLMDFEGKAVFTSPCTRTMLGYDPAAVLGRSGFNFIHREDVAASRHAFERALAGESATFAHRVRHVDGSWRWLEGWGQVVHFHGQPHVLAVSHDVTERRRLEEKLRSAQKMEAIGQLAGGIAHDFNNLLTIIIGYCALLRSALSGRPSLLKEVEEISAAVEKATILTRQLLAFGRRQMLQPKVLNMNDVLTDMLSMLRRLLSEDIELTIRTDPDLEMIHCDRGQIEQVIMNLAINARDAMPDGGKLILAVSNARLDDYPLSQAGQPEPCVLLSVTDTGSGMDAETQAHMFEPFFTTKELGKGTGLGLATVYGIVGQAGGQITVESEVGKGSTFRVYLPRVVEEVLKEPPAAACGPTTGTETILVAEDQEGLRTLVCEVLRRSGYSVLNAANGREALRVFRQHPGLVDLIITDVVMPEMGGRELGTILAASCPSANVLYMSGYDDKAGETNSSVLAGPAFLAKPFQPEALLLKVREVLDRSKPSDRGPFGLMLKPLSNQ